MIFFTSDTHFGHERIIELCDRPFADANHMNSEIVRRWNEKVMPDDTVFHLGDVALGRIDDSLSVVSRLNGHKILVCGNHDRPFMKYGKPAQDDWTRRYEEVFDKVVIGDYYYRDFVMSHFPYDGDSHDADRFTDWRPYDDGQTLLHGHTHSTQRVTYSIKGTKQIHVGMDAWDYSPVAIDIVAAIAAGIY